MSSRNWQLRVQDIIQRIESVTESVSNLDFEYLQNNEILWDTVKNDLPILQRQLQTLLENES